MKIGISGDAGSFSEEAGLLYASKNKINPEWIYLIDMEGVLDAVEHGKIDMGIFPVVNLRGGLVRMAFDAMGRHPFTVIDELWLEVNQCLLAKQGVMKNAIKKIASHPQALAQSREYLQKEFNDAELIEWQDTAKAARDLADGKLRGDCAVIAPRRAGEIYGLNVMAANIQDARPNLTAFIFVKKALSPRKMRHHSF